MVQKSHVPKFGNWDDDNLPYTAFFENARKEKSNGVLINPNDPEENPEAFNFGGSSGGISNGSRSVEKHARQKNGYYYDQQKSTASHKSVVSESSSDKSFSSNSISALKPSHQRKRSDRNKHKLENNIPSSPGHGYKMNCADESACGSSVSVPKFGEWDDKDPRSGEGFTVIFNKMKEEKHIAASKFPHVPLHDNTYYETYQKKKTTSKKCCGLF